MSDSFQAELGKIEATLQSLASLLTGDALAAAQKPLLERKTAILHGNGVIVQGNNNAVLGPGAVQVRGNVYVGLPPENASQAVRIYCELLASTTSSLPLRGVDRTVADPASAGAPIGLANVYVDLDTTTHKPNDKARGEPSGSLLKRIETSNESRPLTAIEAIVANPKMVLLGDPGSGKSTFVNYVAHCLAMHFVQRKAGWLDKLPGWPTGKPLLPVMVTLRDFARRYAEKLPEKAEISHLHGFISERLQAQNLPQAAEPLEQALEGGFALLLLDGLDEVPTQPQRIFVRDAVRAFLGRYPKCRALITCRVLSYQPPAKNKPDLRLNELPTFELAEFDDDKIARFIQAWYSELGRAGTVKPEDVDTLTARLQEAVGRPDLARLAPNPLLLTVMALVHTHQGRLPDVRALLYEETVDILLWRWEQIKLGGSETAPRLRQYLIEAGRTDIDLKRVLWKLAYTAHSATKPDDDGEHSADIAEHDLETALAALKPAADHENGDRNWALKVVDVIKARSGLLLERQPGVFAFPHRTFQEYLAGADLAAQKGFARNAVELARQGALWREVILCAVGRLIYVNGDPEKALALISELCPEKESNSEAAWRLAWLAGDVLGEIGIMRACESPWGCDLTERVRQRLAHLVTQGALAPVERARAGDTLAKLGDPRPEVTTIAGMQFCLIPPGPFVMGGSEYDNEKPQHTNLHLTYPYWLSRYPVTVAQWREYGEANGTEYEYWQYNSQPNRPIVVVTWYQAMEFCTWLTKQFASALPKGYAFTLPSEAEWEKAARGGEKLPQQAVVCGLADGLALPQKLALISNPDAKREYPWPGQFDPNQANIDVTSIGSTSAVGCFPGGVSPYGLLEMSGNVWEWTRSLWGTDWQNPDFKYPYDPKDGRENIQANENTRRVLRGGSFYYVARFARCACRLRNLPVYGGGLIGVRVVVLPCR
jgi:formylglycine-generating enzyme required for sulfatase activity